MFSRRILKRLHSSITKDHIQGFKAFLQPTQVLEGDIEKYTTDWQGQKKAKGSVVLFPKSSEEVAKILDFCNKNELPVVMQGGNTSLVAGATPDNEEIVMSSEKMKSFIEFDENLEVLSCDAGYTLQEIQEYLTEFGYITPYDLGARGSCVIGGNLATMAGGINFVKYGNLRSYVLGLEVVTGEGKTLNMRSKIRKDNTGTDLKQLFVGSEGTLGVITKVDLLVKREDKENKTLFIKTGNYQNLLDLHNLAKKTFIKDLAAIEYLDRDSYKAVNMAMGQNYNFPYSLEGTTEDTYFMLIEISSQNADYLDQLIEKFYEDSEHLFEDMIMTESETQRDNIWGIREHVVDSCKYIGYTFKYDISLDIKKVEEFMKFTRELYGDRAKLVSAYGHIGDGNIHLNVIANDGYDTKETKELCEEKLMKYLVGIGGSISAEHGVGEAKKQYMSLQKSDDVLGYMRQLKKLFDPKNILNPGKVLKQKVK